MKAGTDYELFVKEVYEAILKCEGIENINVQHDVKIMGASGVERQVDIYWEFRTAGIQYKLIIECKDYKTAVPLEKIDAFHSKVADIGGTIGVFVSKNGYQSGAVELARKYGIQLREIRKPTDKDWEGYIRNIEIQLNYAFICNIHPTFVVDKEWAETNHYSATGFSGQPDNTIIENNDDGTCMAISSIINKLDRTSEGKGYTKAFTYQDAYVRFGEDRVKIKQLMIEYDVAVYQDVIRICGDQLITAIVHDVLAGETMSVRANGDIVREN